MTGAELDRFSGAGHLMQRYLRSIAAGELWYLTTAKGVSRETVAKIHAHFLFVGDTAVVERLRRGAFAETITIKPVYDLPGLVKGYQAKERTPQAGFGRNRQLGGRITGSHKLEGGGDRVRLSRELELDAIEQALVEPWQRTNAKRKADRKEYRKRPLTARAPRLSGQILLFPDMRPVARLQAFGGGYVPPPVAAEIEFRRKQRGLSQNKLASLVGRSQGQLANAIRGHDPISSAVVNRLRDVLLS